VCSALTLIEQTRNGNVRSQLKADTDQARRSVQNVRERCRPFQFGRVTDHKRATKRRNKNSQTLSA
jgi:hypothetical protein